MEIEQFRDLMIIIAGTVVTIAVILAAVVLSSVYRKVNDILKSVRTTAAKIEALTVIASNELGKPVIQAAGIVQGMVYGIREISKIFKKGE
jgi:hypothetical protein